MMPEKAWNLLSPENAAAIAAAEDGTLYIVSTPIGNLADMTLRAVAILQQVHLIAAEDTRHSRKLLAHYAIQTPLWSFHDFNKERQAPKLIEQLSQGKSVALISDAGTPGISDPGFYLIREAIRRGITVQAIPGPTALIPALVVSGLPVHRFAFDGYPPAKKGRKKFFEQLQPERRTMILYESPHRLLRTLRDILSYLGDRHLVVARELTKKFEQVYRGRASEVLNYFENTSIRGEIVLVIEGFSEKQHKEER